MPQTITNPEYDVAKLNKGKVSYFWEGYNIVQFTENGGAWASQKGSYRNGKYGYKKVFPVNSEGQWIL